VGLAQNLAALRVLATEGVQRGHMSLHAKNLAASVGASAEEAEIIVDRLIEEKAFRFDRAESLLAELRSGGARRRTCRSGARTRLCPPGSASARSAPATGCRPSRGPFPCPCASSSSAASPRRD